MKNTGTPAPGNDTQKTKSTSGMVKPASDAATELREFFVDCLKDIYWAENALTKALPLMAQNATSANLASAIKDHLVITLNQITRLEKVFRESS